MNQQLIERYFTTHLLLIIGQVFYKMCSLALPTLYLSYIGGWGGRNGSGSSSINDLCWHQNSGTPIRFAKSLIKHILQPHSMRPSLFCIVSYGRSSDEECVLEVSFVHKASTDENEF